MNKKEWFYNTVRKLDVSQSIINIIIESLEDQIKDMSQKEIMNAIDEYIELFGGY